MSAVQNNGERWRFWTAVRAEMRATWWGRWRWLWLGLGVAYFLSEALFTWADHSELGWHYEWQRILVSSLVCWPAAWLGSDLLSTRFDANPEPLRPWRPAEFLARFLGRLAPLLGAVVATVVPFSLQTGPYEFTVSRWLVDLDSDAKMFVAMGLAYAGAASMVSGLSNRPRRWLITTIVMFGSILLSPWLTDDVLDNGLSEWVWLVATPNEGMTERLYGWVNAPGVPWIVGEFFRSCIRLYLSIAIVTGLWTWWIAARRYRRSRAVQPDE